MSLSCSCGDWDWDGEPGTWSFYSPDDFSKFNKSRRKRCCSCGQLIDIGTDCLEFQRVRAPWTEIEQRILGDEIVMASFFMCGECGEIYLNLSDVGYCLAITDSMEELLEEYHELTGFDRK